MDKEMEEKILEMLLSQTKTGDTTYKDLNKMIKTRKLKIIQK